MLISKNILIFDYSVLSYTFFGSLSTYPPDIMFHLTLKSLWKIEFHIITTNTSYLTPAKPNGVLSVVHFKWVHKGLQRDWKKIMVNLYFNIFMFISDSQNGLSLSACGHTLRTWKREEREWFIMIYRGSPKWNKIQKLEDTLQFKNGNFHSKPDNIPANF